MRIPTVLAALLVASPMVQAAPNCPQSEDGVLFHCKIQGSSRELTICDLPNGQYLYQYGKPGETQELIIQSTREEVVYTPWNGMGNTIWARLGFRNKGYFYDVSRSIQKGGESPPEGALDVYEPGNDTPITTKQCRTGTVRGDLDGLWERFN